MDEETEYEVECIVEARVEKKGARNKDLAWKFRVRWKGYGSEDDTWEPIESFEGSSDNLLETFWDRAGDGRDIHDLRQFKAGEHFAPTGPPRRKGKRKSTFKEPTTPVVPLRQNSPTIIEVQASPTKRRRSMVDVLKEARPLKRTREKGPSTSSNGAASSQRKDVSSPMTRGSTTRRDASVSRSSQRRKTAVRPPSSELIPDSDEELEISMQLNMRSRSSADQSSQPDGGEDDINTLSELETQADKAPGHHQGTNKTLVKFDDDPNISAHDGQTTAKSHNIKRNQVLHGSSSILPSTRTNRNKNVASLLTAGKNGMLRSIKGQYHNQSTSTQTNARDAREEPINADPPGADELLFLAGIQADEAGELADFVEDVEPPPNGPVAPDNSVQDQSMLHAAAQRSESLNLAKETLFPSSSYSDPTTTELHTWKQSTIFGPLGLANESSVNGSMEAGPESPNTSSFSLNLDASVSIPALLTDPLPVNAKLALDIQVSYKSPPGKFYSSSAATAVLDAIRTGRGCGRVLIRVGASEEHKKHFTLFSQRLEQGELFIGSAGTQMYAFCSSSNGPLCERLNIPPSYQVSSRQVLVALVVVENYSGYADAAANADTLLWSSYASSH
ncbi:hypothetical protein FA15DRAFT_663331 [Coprinopsis marcescibilis]|uniref:Chromo domain-containing protein n=1 Tax=Coprinopsis marcescibilis TaxID=230819 RepID=A0A5C3LB43_COPMA|nr:hypothetical protein FA15DRAFT_663331 [Coprinopsis marcescibilis]